MSRLAGSVLLAVLALVASKLGLDISVVIYLASQAALCLWLKGE